MVMEFENIYQENYTKRLIKIILVYDIFIDF